MASKLPRVEFYKTKSFGFGAARRDLWRWRMIARNGRIIVASSEGFNNQRNAARNFDAVQAAFAGILEITYAD